MVIDWDKYMVQMLDSGRLLQLDSLLGAVSGSVATVVGAVSGVVGAAVAAAGGWLGGAHGAVRAKLSGARGVIGAKVSGVGAAYAARRAPASAAAVAVSMEKPPADADLLKSRNRHAGPAASDRLRKSQMAGSAALQGVAHLAAEDAAGVTAV